ncbi:MAG TPA: MaoC family dehydratase [Blastocatellia bacterium]|nr:MaoC family dehydratase [Blastocatellia bacterium]
MPILPVYRVRARNTSADSENKIHEDATAASYGFRGGLVPGITVYAYMTVPVVERLGIDWFERGSMQVKFHKPFYDGEEVIVRAEADEKIDGVEVIIAAEREDGAVCATAVASLSNQSTRVAQPRLEDYPQAPLPNLEARPVASRESLAAGTMLGTLTETIGVDDSNLLESLDERLPIYFGGDAVAHPFVLLRMANQILMSNYRLGPWIHAGSDLTNRSAARVGDEISMRGRIWECFERKGHEFAVLDLLLVGNGNRILQQVRHTAIYLPRSISG